MNTLAKRSALLFGMLVLASACGGGSAAGTGDAGGGGGACKVYTVCDLVTAADVSGVFNATYTATEHDVNAMPSSSMAEDVSCGYFTPAPDGGPPPFLPSIAVRCCPCGDNDPASVRANAGSDVTDVSGVGDTAFWAIAADDPNGLSAGVLYVFVGQDVLITVNITTTSGTFDEAGALADAKQLALLAVQGL